MTQKYDDNQVARYIGSYIKMHEASAMLNSSLSLYNMSTGELKNHLKSPIRDFAISLRRAIEDVRTEVPQSIRDRVCFGKTPDQLESLATNTLLELGE